MRARKAYTLAELIVVVLILATLVTLAAPRLQFDLVSERQAEVAARKLVMVLRRTRSLAISHAATNPKGFALNIKQTGTSTTYEIVDSDNKDVIEMQAIDATIDLSGRMKFEFGPLGNLTSTYTYITVSAEGKNFIINIVRATGTIKCVEF